MGFRYMASDSELAKGGLGEATSSDVRVRAGRPRSKIKMRVWFLLAANLIVFTIVCVLLADDEKPPVWEAFTVNKEIVSGISYRANDPAAVVYGQVVSEGDTVNGCKVIRIHRDRVVMEKDGQRFARWLYR